MVEMPMALPFFGRNEKAISRMVIDGNTLADLKLGSSEALVLNGNVEDFEITNNIVRNCNNIGIDIIGFEKIGPKGFDQARNGANCRQPSS